MVQLTDHTEDLAYLPDADDRCINVGKVNSLTFIILCDTVFYSIDFEFLQVCEINHYYHP